MAVSGANFDPVQSFFGSGFVPGEYVPDLPSEQTNDRLTSIENDLATYSGQVGVASVWGVLIFAMALSTLWSRLAG